MKRAFTLLELLTVIAIMGILGTVSIGGYQAITRGMNERAALDVARNIADTARQRANLDRCRTYLFLYNEVQSLTTDEEPGQVCGLAIAVKGAGRISGLDGTDKWLDEFGDLDKKFRAMEKDGEELTEDEMKQKAGKFRLFKLTNEGKYAIVRDGVVSSLTEKDLEDGQTHQYRRFGYEKISGNISFSVGEEYGKEFGVVRLPKGFVFSSSVNMKSETDLGLHFVKGYVIDWGKTDSEDLEVYAQRPDGNFKKIGSTRNLKDAAEE